MCTQKDQKFSGKQNVNTGTLLGVRYTHIHHLVLYLDDHWTLLCYGLTFTRTKFFISSILPVLLHSTVFYFNKHISTRVGLEYDDVISEVGLSRILINFIHLYLNKCSTESGRDTSKCKKVMVEQKSRTENNRTK